MTYSISEEWEKIEAKNFTLIKDLTMLIGTVFGSSIALSVGRTVNIRFILGEILLFIALCAGIVNLYAYLKGEEASHFIMTIGELELNARKRNGGKEDFLVDAQDKLIKNYEQLLKNNQNDPLTFFLKVVKIDYFYPAMLITFLLGVFFILISLFDFSFLSYCSIFCYN